MTRRALLPDARTWAPLFWVTMVPFAGSACGGASQPPTGRSVDGPVPVVELLAAEPVDTAAASLPPPPATATAPPADGLGTDWTRIPWGTSTATLQRQAEPLDSEPCAVGGPGTTGIDMNGDGQPDVQRLVQAGKRVCQTVDLDFDGQSDVVVHYDAQQRERRKALDLDHDGQPDLVEVYREGSLTAKLLDTDGDGRSDTWREHDGTKLVRIERDTNGDGRGDWLRVLEGRSGCGHELMDLDADGLADLERRICHK